MNNPVRSSHMSMAKLELLDGEKEKNQWVSSGWMFTQQFIAIGLFTAVVFGGFRPFNSLFDWLMMVPVILIYGTIFGDFQDWATRRHDTWLLTNKRLAYFGLADEIENMSIPLEHISKISFWFWWGLTIKMFDGNKISMRYLNSPNDVKRKILKAREILVERLA